MALPVIGSLALSRTPAIRAYRSEGPLSADSVEKQRVASAEIRAVIVAQAPFLSGLARLLRCRKYLRQLAEVLGGGGEEEFVICAAWAS